MAVTKIHPIKSTLKKALDYIENPDKTDEKLFVSSYGCSYETADMDKKRNAGRRGVDTSAPGAFSAY